MAIPKFHEVIYIEGQPTHWAVQVTFVYFLYMLSLVFSFNYLLVGKRWLGALRESLNGSNPSKYT